MRTYLFGCMCVPGTVWEIHICSSHIHTYTLEYQLHNSLTVIYSYKCMLICTCFCCCFNRFCTVKSSRTQQLVIDLSHILQFLSSWCGFLCLNLAASNACHFYLTHTHIHTSLVGARTHFLPQRVDSALRYCVTWVIHLWFIVWLTNFVVSKYANMQIFTLTRIHIHILLT